MRTREVVRWLSPGLLRRLRDVGGSLWLLPCILALGGAALGFALTQPRWRWSVAGALQDAIPPDAAGDLLGAAATAVAALLAVGFSIATVTVQLAASQYTPRLLRRFMADRPTRYVLGVYAGSLAYLLVALRGVRVAGPPGGESAAQAAVALGLALAVVCVVLLPYFLHHVTRSIQVATIVTRVAKDTARAVANLEFDGEIIEQDRAHATSAVRSARAGYVQVIDVGALVAALPRGTERARVEVAVGDFVLPNAALVSIWPAVNVTDGSGRIEAAFAFARERNLPQDTLFGVQQLVDMALRALSPGVNDVTTAVMALNELGTIAVALAQAGAPATAPWRVARDRDPAIVVRTLSLDAFVRAGLDEIVLAARDQPRVLSRLLQILDHAEEIARGANAAAVFARAARRVRDVACASEVPSVLRRAEVFQRTRLGARLGGSTGPEPPVQ